MKKLLLLLSLAALSASAVQAIPITRLDLFQQNGALVDWEITLLDDETGEALEGESWWNDILRAPIAHNYGGYGTEVAYLASRPWAKYGLNEIWFVMADGYRTNSVFITLNRVPDAGATALLIGGALIGLVAVRRRPHA